MSTRKSWAVGIGLLGLVLAATVGLVIGLRYAPGWGSRIGRPAVNVELGKVPPALEYRIVSFHKGKADKRLIRLASELGFNGVQFQIEGSTEDGIKDFAQRDGREHLVQFCHQLGMKVTIWVHEFSDFPSPWLPESLGKPTTDSQAIWAKLDERYERFLRTEIPNVDGLVLTVVESQIRATDSDVMVKLVALLRQKCDKYHKSLIVRTFVWYPAEFATVMKAVDRLPADTVIMTKCVPQDWNLRGMFASEIGQVGGRKQIIEYDVEGEYFRWNFVANCMPELLKKHFDYGMQKNVSGICVRVDRDDDNVLDEPSEVNLWTLGMLADGATDDLNEIWLKWATNRFGAAGAPGVIAALKPTGKVVDEMLNIGPFSFGDTRKFPLLGNEDVFGQLHQNWWWDKSYEPAHQQAEAGEAGFTAKVAAGKQEAMKLADQCLAELEKVRDKLEPNDYAILKTRLMTNKVQLAFRAPMIMAVLHYRRMISTDDAAEQQRMDQAIQQDLQEVRAAAMPIYAKPRQIWWLGKMWNVDVPDDVNRSDIFQWAYSMDLLRQGIDPHPAPHRKFQLPTSLSGRYQY